MIREKSDYTRTFRLLSHSEQLSAASPLRDEFIDARPLTAGLPGIVRGCVMNRWTTRSASRGCRA